MGWGGIYAPDIKYNPQNQTYYMITTNVGYGNFYVKTKDPFANEWSEPILLPEIHGIDPSFLFDTDGKAYIVHNDSAPDNAPEYDGHCTIRLYEFDVENDCVKGEEVILVNKGTKPEEQPIWIEGPHLYHIGEYYYLMCAEGGTGDNHSEVVFRATRPEGPYEVWNKNPMLTQRTLGERENPVTCSGHGDLFQAYDGSWNIVFLACRPIDGEFENLGRETFMLPVTWTADKWPFVTYDPIACGDKAMTVVDEFDTETLDLQWLTLRQSASDLYTIEDGCLKLNCSTESIAEHGVPAYVGRRMQHHEFTAETALTFTPQEGEADGLGLYKDEWHYYFCALTSEGLKVTNNEGELASCELAPNTNSIKLKCVSTGRTYDFYYSLDGEEWTAVVKDLDARYLSTANANGFTGSTVGMYCVSINDQALSNDIQ